jgi:hypothetical protein
VTVNCIARVNAMVARTAPIDREVLATLAEDVLRPTVINRAIALALEELGPSKCGSRTSDAAGGSLPCWTG